MGRTSTSALDLQVRLSHYTRKADVDVGRRSGDPPRYLPARLITDLKSIVRISLCR